MGLVRDDDLVQVDLPDGGWVKVKRKFSGGDFLAIKQAGARAASWDQNLAAREIHMDIFLAAAEFTALEIAIKEWSFSENGEPVAVTPENIRRLEREDIALIRDEIDKLNPTRSEEEKKDSSGTPTSPSEKGSNGQASLPTSPSLTELEAGTTT